MTVPWNIAFGAWLAFPCAAIVGIVLAAIYYCYFKDKLRVFAATVCISCVVLSLLAIIIIPVDVFLVSSTKAQNGTYYKWASNSTIKSLETTVVYIYYVIYGLMILFVFVLLPYGYFSSVQCEADDRDAQKLATVRGVKYAFASFVLLCILFVVGIVVPMGDLPGPNSTIYHQMYLLDLRCLKVLEDGLTFVINCLCLVGMICSIIYTAYGMSILPINMIKGQPSRHQQKEQMEASVNELMEKIREMTNQRADQCPLGEADRRLLNKYSVQLSALQSRNDNMRHESYNTALLFCKCFMRPLQVACGIVLLLFSLLIMVNLTLSNVNRAISSLGLHAGYMANRTVLPNPINSLLLLSSKIFPLDYIVLGLIVLFIVLSSVCGMQHLDLWFFWVKIHRIRAHSTTTQALLFSAFVLVTVTLYSSLLAYDLAPQYITYGTQSYRINSTKAADSSLHYTVMACSMAAPAAACTMTRLMSFQTRLFYRMWFFGVAYFWSSWLFILVFTIGCAVSAVRARKTVAELMRRKQNEDEELRPLI